MRAAVMATVTVLILTGCGGDSSPRLPLMPKPLPVEDPARIVWNFEPQGIRILLETAQELNILDHKSHALSLCLYQLKDKEAFEAKIQTRAGLLELLECRTGAPGMVTARQLFVQPGKKDIFYLDRAEGARYLAVVAGYNELIPENCAKVTAMPVHVDQEGSIPFFKTTVYEAADMDAFLSLSIQAVNLTGAERVQ